MVVVVQVVHGSVVAVVGVVWCDLWPVVEEARIVVRTDKERGLEQAGGGGGGG